MRRRAVFGWSALFGFFVGILLCGVSGLIERAIEGARIPPTDPTPIFRFAFLVVCGVVWAVICTISFPIMWYRIRPTKPPLEILGWVAFAAFVVESVTFTIYDELFTRFDLTRWMYRHVNDYVHSSIDMTIFVLPAIIAAYLAMRLVSRRG